MFANDNRFRALAGIMFLVGLMYSEASFAQTSISGTLNHDQYLTVPAGTTVHDWSVIVSPAIMGLEEGANEGDNALLRFEAHVVPVNDYTWRMVARFKYRWSNYGSGIWYAGTVHYLMVRKQ